MYFNCSNNQLTNFDFLYSITEEFGKLRKLDISNNKFPPTDLANIYLLKNFVDLEELDLSNNLFYGSLEAFQNLTKLRELRIGDTDINWGLQYLPENVHRVNTNSQDRECSASKI
jgi:Leucine-rich repeat (LRR) protein